MPDPANLANLWVILRAEPGIEWAILLTTYLSALIDAGAIDCRASTSDLAALFYFYCIPELPNASVADSSIHCTVVAGLSCDV